MCVGKGQVHSYTEYFFTFNYFLHASTGMDVDSNQCEDDVVQYISFVRELAGCDMTVASLSTHMPFKLFCSAPLYGTD